MDKHAFDLRQRRRAALAEGLTLIEDATSPSQWRRGLAWDTLRELEWDLEEFTVHYVSGACSGA